MKRFLLWLLPYYLGPERKCAKCGYTGQKASMHRFRPYGWFCSEAEFAEYWQDFQW